MTKPEIIAALQAIAQGNALSAVIENDLEERGLIVQDHRPFAHLTQDGRDLLLYSRHIEARDQ